MTLYERINGKPEPKTVVSPWVKRAQDRKLPAKELTR